MVNGDEKVMTTEITIPIKCSTVKSTVKKVKSSVPVIAFWIVGAVSIILFILFLMQQNTFMQLVVGILIHASISFLLLWMLCPYKFKCIQD